MYPFEYSQADSASAALTSASKPDTRYLAGGTTLIDLMRLDVERPAHLVDVSALPLGRIDEIPGGGLRIGAMVLNSDCADNELVRARYPVLSMALLSGASAQIRNMATVGGNILQRTRCYYFRDVASPCNKREPGAGCSAIGGYTRIHAVLGTSPHCIAANPSDMNVALAALGAFVVVRSEEGERRIPFVDFHLLPGEHPERETVLEHGDLITAVEIPHMPFASRSTYLKLRDRASFAFALASAAVVLDLRGGVVHEARIALGGVGTKPWRSFEAEKELAGQKAAANAFRAAAETALAGARSYGDNGFKIELAKRALVRALTQTSRMA